jgi:SsrA-binding protein
VGGKKKQGGSGELVVCTNRRATQRYAIEERFEAGLVLTGSEVKSLRGRQANLDGAFAAIDHGELWLHGMHIAPYEQAGPFGHEPLRKRKLLVHRHEILRLTGKLARSGLTLVPMRVYFKNRRAKIELGLGTGKRKGDNRESIRRKLDLDEARAAMSRRRGRE